MLENYFKRPHVLARMKTNILYSQMRKLIYYFHDSGYSIHTIQSYMQKIEHFGNWLKANRVTIRSVDKDTIKSFIDEHLPNCYCTVLHSYGPIDIRAALNHLLHILPFVKQKQKKPLKTPAEKEVQKFRGYLKEVCGLSDSTIHYHARFVTEFLVSIFKKRLIKHHMITPARIIKYVSDKAGQYKPDSIKVLAYSLRCYFRFLQFKGKCSRNLIEAVPTIPHWKLSELPKTMTKEQLSKFRGSFDRRTLSGQRDYAMALCFIELGLRASEVTNLSLDDIDWENSTVNVRALKTLRSRILPLPVHLGKALVCYLQNGRPKTDFRNIFIRHSVPKGKPVTIYIVRNAMRFAHERAGLSEHVAGTHVFRHTAATLIHQKGATLKEVADILGHKSIDSTIIYTKLNNTMLAEVALPWPEVES